MPIHPLTLGKLLINIAKVGAKNHDTSNGTWLAHPIDAAIAQLAKRTTDSVASSFFMPDSFYLCAIVYYNDTTNSTITEDAIAA